MNLESFRPYQGHFKKMRIIDTRIGDRCKGKERKPTEY